MKYLILIITLFGGFGVAAAISGNLRTTVDYYSHDYGEPTSTLSPYISAEFANKHKLTKRWRARWRLYGLANPNNLHEPSTGEKKYEPETLYGDIPEGNLEYRYRDFKYRMGMNTLNWGVVDLSSPSDVVNSMALFHPLRILKRGSPMVETQFGPETFAWHFVYIPKQMKPILPSENSRWLPREILLQSDSDDTIVRIPDQLRYGYSPERVLTHALDHNYGARLTSHLGSWDFQLTHFEGVAPTPKIQPEMTLDFGSTSNEFIARSPILLIPVLYRVRTSGLGMVYAGDSWIFRFESAYQHTISESPSLTTSGDVSLQPWSWTSVAAAETSVPLGATTLTLLTQYYHSENPQSPDNQISSTYRLFDRTAILGLRWSLSEETTVMASGLYESLTQGVFWMVGFESKFTDSTKWSLGWRDFSAQKDGLLKTYEKNDHATLDLTYYF